MPTILCSLHAARYQSPKAHAAIAYPCEIHTCAYLSGFRHSMHRLCARLISRLLIKRHTQYLCKPNCQLNLQVTLLQWYCLRALRVSKLPALVLSCQFTSCNVFNRTTNKLLCPANVLEMPQILEVFGIYTLSVRELLRRKTPTLYHPFLE